MNPKKPSASTPPMSFAVPMSSVAAPSMFAPWPKEVKEATAGPSPCQALTPVALQGVLNKVAESLAQADQDVAQNGTKGVPPNASLVNQSALRNAHDYFLRIQEYLQQGGFFSAGYVNNQTAAWNVLNGIHYFVNELHLAQHHATLSVANNTSRFAWQSYNLTAEAIVLAEQLGQQAGRCFCGGYLK